MNKTVKITLSGGFHDSDEITVRAKVDGNYAYLSKNQIKRLDKHFCGMDDCCCGAQWRADKVIADKGWEIASSLVNDDEPAAQRS